MALECKKLIAGIASWVGAGAAMAHGASYDHNHTLIDSPAMLLCLVALVGVIASISKSAGQMPRPIPIEIDQRYKRVSEESQ
jgi:hypothetical protein